MNGRGHLLPRLRSLEGEARPTDHQSRSAYQDRPHTRGRESVPAHRGVRLPQAGKRPASDPRWDVGIEAIHVAPEMSYPGFGPEPIAFNQSFAITYDHPAGRG